MNRMHAEVENTLQAPAMPAKVRQCYAHGLAFVGTALRGQVPDFCQNPRNMCKNTYHLMISIAAQQIHVTRITPITSARAVWFGDRTLKPFVSVLLVFAKRSSMFRWHTNPTQLPLVPWQFCFHSFLVSTIKLLHDQGLLQCVCGLLLHAVGQQPSETGKGQSRALCISHFAGVWCVGLRKWCSSQGLPDGHARPENNAYCTAIHAVGKSTVAILYVQWAFYILEYTVCHTVCHIYWIAFPIYMFVTLRRSGYHNFGSNDT